MHGCNKELLVLSLTDLVDTCRDREDWYGPVYNYDCAHLLSGIVAVKVVRVVIHVVHTDGVEIDVAGEPYDAVIQVIVHAVTLVLLPVRIPNVIHGIPRGRPKLDVTAPLQCDTSFRVLKLPLILVGPTLDTTECRFVARSSYGSCTSSVRMRGPRSTTRGGVQSPFVRQTAPANCGWNPKLSPVQTSKPV
jgi:hypothetical protein